MDFGLIIQFNVKLTRRGKPGITGDVLKEKRQKEAYPVILQFEKWMYETATRSSQNRIA